MEKFKHLFTATVFSTLLLLNLTSINAQVAINTDGSAPDGSAMLDIKSTNKGVLVPRLSSTQLDSVQNPATGLMVFVTDLGEFLFFDGTDWDYINSSKPDDDWVYTTGKVYNTSDRIGIGGLPYIGTKTTIWNTTESTTLEIKNNDSTSNSNPQYGIHTVLEGEGIGYQVALGNYVLSNGDGTHFGVKNSISNSGSGTHYGVYNSIKGSGSGRKYGSYNYIYSSAGGPHYGVYSVAEGSGHYSGYFKGRMYVSDSMGIGTDSPQALLHLAGSFRLSDGSQGDGKILSSDADGNTSWVDGSTLNGGGWTVTGDTLYSALDSTVTIKGGKVGIGINNPNKKLYVSENISGLSYPLKLENKHSSVADDAVGVLFSSGGLGSNGRGKGGLVYEVTDTWNRGSFHFLQNSALNSENPGLNNAVFTILNNGNTGVGIKTPLVKLHIRDTDISLPSSALHDESFVIEDSDAALGIYSSDGGNFGSLLSFGEINQGDLVNKWSIVRTTSNYSSHENQLRFTFGSNVNAANNPTFLTLGSTGSIGIGTTQPKVKLNITGGSDASLTNGSGYLLLGYESGLNIVMDNNEIIARNNGVSSTLFIQCSGSTSNTILNENGGKVGIGTSTPGELLDVDGAMHLKPGSVPTTANEGDIYMDSSTHKLRCYDGTSWHDLW